MNNNEYEDFVRSTWTTNVTDDQRPIWAAGELTAEAGEVMGVAIKSVRKAQPLDVDRFTDELGDVLWSLTAGALSVGMDLSGLMTYNKDKLEKRLGRK